MYQALNTLTAHAPGAWPELPCLSAELSNPAKIATIKLLLKLRHDVEASTDAVVSWVEEYSSNLLHLPQSPTTFAPPTFPLTKLGGVLETLEVNCDIEPTEDLHSMTLVASTSVGSLGANNLNPLVFSIYLKPSTPCQTQLVILSPWEFDVDKSAYSLKILPFVDAEVGQPTITACSSQLLTSTYISMPRMCPVFPRKYWLYDLRSRMVTLFTFPSTLQLQN